MPIPVRDDGTPGPDHHLMVFVHGFMSDAGCWNQLLDLLKHDERFANYDLRCYSYPTAFVQPNLLRRIPRLKELASGLRTFLDPLLDDLYIDVTLVGHSQGGLVIQSYLAEELAAGRGRGLAPIRQILLVGTPNAGSTIGSTFRRAFFAFFANPQERILRVLDDEVADIRRVIQQRVVDATERTEQAWPIPIHAFWGQQDGIVVESSARAAFSASTPLPGDHFGIIRPTGPQDPAYDTLSRAILEPVGHTHIFEIERFRFSVAVQPRPVDEEVLARYGGHERVVVSDNMAKVVQSVSFSRQNRCSNLFTMRYLTRNTGFVEPTVSHPNEASPDLVGRWKDEGTSAYFQFHPQNGARYELSAAVYKGFDDGHRDVHSHCGKQSFYRHYEFVIDLSAYLAAGWTVTKPPELYFLRFDPDHDELCARRNTAFPDPPVAVDNGVWRWDLEYLREGVVDVRWDIAAPRSAQ
jgi:pimeloyl-ACP methyl ester carboxylesterase